MVLCLTMALSVLSPAVSVGEVAEEIVDVVEPAPEPVVTIEEVVAQPEPEPQVEAPQAEPEQQVEAPQAEPEAAQEAAPAPEAEPVANAAPVEEVLEPQYANGQVDELKAMRLEELADLLSNNPGRGEQQAYDDAVEAINDATDTDAIDAAFSEGKANIASQYALDQKKTSAYEELVELADGNEDALAVIDEEKIFAPSVTETALNSYVSEKKTQIQSILDAAAALAELNEAKADALTALEEAKSVNAGDRETKAYNAAVKAVNDAETVAAVEAAVEEATAEDGSLATARAADEAAYAAIEALEKAAADSGSESDAMAELLESEIGKVRAAETVEAIEAAKTAGIEAIEQLAAEEEAEAEAQAAAAKALAEAKTAAEEEISAFVQDSYVEKFGDAPDEVTEAVTAAIAAVEAAETVEEVGEVKAAQLAEIENTAIPFAKQAALGLLDEAADESDNVKEAVLDAKVAIEAIKDDETTLADIADVLDQNLEIIDGLKAANALAAAKEEAKAEIDALVAEDASDAVKAIAEAAKTSIDDAEDLEAVSTALEEGKAAIAEQIEQDEADAEALAEAKEAAKAKIDEVKSEEPGEKEAAAIEALLDEIDNATLDTIEEITEKIEATIEAAKVEDEAAAEADELGKAKAAAVEALVLSEKAGYAEQTAYDEAVAAIMAVEMGDEEDALETALKAVDDAKTAGQKAIDEGKATDEELASEKTRVKAEIDLAVKEAGVEADDAIDNFKAEIDQVELSEDVDLEAAKAAIADIQEAANEHIEQLKDEAAAQAEIEAAQAALLQAIEDGKNAVNEAFEAIESPTNTQTKYVQDILKKLDALKDKTEGTLEEIKAATAEAKEIADEAVDTLKGPAAKVEALAALEEKYAALDEDDQAAMEEAYKAAKAAINVDGATPEDMDKALADFDAALELYNVKKAAKAEIDQIADETATGDLATARTEALEAIDNSADEEAVEEAVATYTEMLNSIIAFEAYKADAEDELDQYVADKNGGAGAERAAEAANNIIDGFSFLAGDTNEDVDDAVKTGKENIDKELKLDAYREAAKKELDDYLSVDADVAPSEAPTEWKALQEAKANIDAETTTNSTQIDEFVEAGKAAMLAARDLDPYKNAAKEKVIGYKMEGATAEEEQVIEDICAEIDAAETKDEVDALVNGAAARIAVARGLGVEKEKALKALEEAAEGYEDYENVADALETAKENVNNAEDEDTVAEVKENGITAIKQEICTVVYEEAIEAVEAEAADVDSREVKNALADAKAAIDAAYAEGADAKEAIETARDEGIAAIAAAKALYEAKAAAKEEIDSYAEEKLAECEFIDEFSDDLNDLLDEHKEIIDTANNLEAVDQFVTDAKEAIDLQLAKDDAKAEVESNAPDENGEVTAAVQNLVEEGKANIDAAKDLEAVEKAKNDALEDIAEQKGKDGNILEAAKADAIKNLNVTDEEERGDNENAAYEEARTAILAATTINGVNKAKEDGQDAIDAAKILDDQIAEALAEIKLSENAGEEEKKAYEETVERIKAAKTKEEIDQAVADYNSSTEILKAKDEAIAAIEEAAGDPETRGVHTQAAVETAKAAIAAADTLINVGKAEAEQIALVKKAVELDTAKEEAKAAIDELVDEDASDEVKALAEEAKAAIDEAEDLDGVKAAQEAGEAAIAEQKAAEEAAAALAAAKEEAIEEVKAAAVDASGDVQRIAAEAEAKINSAETLEEVATAKNDALNAIAEQKAAEEAAAALAAAKEEAKAAIDELVEETDSDEVKAIAEAAKQAIDEAEDLEAVEAAFAAGEAAIAEQKAADEIAPVVEFVKRNYELILGREADESGLNYWTTALRNRDMTGAEVVNGFVISNEFTGRNYSNEERVEILYAVILGREPDEDGLKYWTGLLEAGVSDSYIVNGFATSPEFIGICEEYDIEAGKVSNLEWRDRNVGVTQFVGRCYEMALTRAGDVNGINHWCETLLNKYETPQQVAESFVFSEECIGRKLSDQEFVEMLYNLYMGRNSDEGGMSYWLGNLSTNTMTREQVSAEFAASPEFSQIVASYGL